MLFLASPADFDPQTSTDQDTVVKVFFVVSSDLALEWSNSDSFKHYFLVNTISTQAP